MILGIIKIIINNYGKGEAMPEQIIKTSKEPCTNKQCIDKKYMAPNSPNSCKSNCILLEVDELIICKNRTYEGDLTPNELYKSIKK